MADVVSAPSMPSVVGSCRHCGAPLAHTFCDLGMSPLANAYVSAERATAMEPFYPLHAYVCARCFLVQLQEFERPEDIFSDYAYFSSYSQSWLAHARAYTEAMTARFGLGCESLVVEIASNDGYLLQYFRESGVPVLGIEPAANIARVAAEKQIPTRVTFFNAETARALRAEGVEADLLLGNNVLAHVPRLHDFVEGLRVLLKPGGVITMEFPHVLRLMRETQFDTIYHEHFSYFSLLAVEQVFAAHRLRLFDVEQLETHGGSLRIFAAHESDAAKPESARVSALRHEERHAGLAELGPYLAFGERAKRTKRALLRFLIDAKDQGKTVVGYGAPAKGNTLLNYCGIGPDLIEYTVDRSPHKQGRMLPGVRIRVDDPERIARTRPDYVLILPWNIKDEVIDQMAHVRAWGARFVVPIPEVTILS